jgi:hypothetical protein
MKEEEFPSNSRNKAEPEKGTKKVEKIVTGDVSRRKPPLGRRFRELFVGGDAKSVGGYVLLDILLPAIKDTVADMVSQGVERMLFGDTRSTSRRTGQRPSGNSGYVSYNRYSSASSPWNREKDRREEPRVHRARTRGSHNFDDIILATRAEAEEVIDRLFDLVSRYEQATVSDLYELVGIESNFTDEKWGWTDIRGAGVTRISSGYLLDLPRPEPLD